MQAYACIPLGGLCELPCIPRETGRFVGTTLCGVGISAEVYWFCLSTQGGTMKGSIFNQFFEWVDNRFGLETTELLIDTVAPASGGAYTNVGAYDHTELLAMLVELSHLSHQPINVLANHFGRHCFPNLAIEYPESFEQSRNVFEFVSNIETFHRCEVRKLYPDAEVPRFTVASSAKDQLQLEYHSSRPLADFAEGLIEGCIEYFGEDIQLQREDTGEKNGTSARFLLTVRQEELLPCKQ